MGCNLDFLRDFIDQSATGNLKTAQYPKEFKSFRMKVSFGQGAQARVPWISFYTSGMSTSNGYYPVYLLYREAKKLVLSFGVSETNDFGEKWKDEILGDSKVISDVIDNPPRYGNSWVYKIYDVSDFSKDCQFSTNGKSVSDLEMHTHLDEILNLFSRNLDQAVVEVNSPIGAGLFYMEKQLEDFIIENWETTPLSENLELIYEEGVLKSQQFKTGIGPIDILAKDKKTGNFVVIELKRNQTSDDTVGQILRYMGWVKENLKDPNVRGLIIAGKYDDKLHYAQSMMNTIDVFLYEVAFSLREHSR